MKTIFLFLANGFEETEAIVSVDVLRRAGFNVRTVSISNSQEVVGTHNIVIKADLLLKNTDCSVADCLILPGGMPGASNLDQNEELKKILVAHNQQGKLIAAICAAPLVLGRLNLLVGKEAVCYPGFEKYLEGATLVKGKLIFCDNIITAKGPGCVFDFALKIVEVLQDRDCAEQIVEGLIW